MIDEVVNQVIDDVVDQVEQETGKNGKKNNLPAAKGFVVENKTPGQKFVDTFFGEDLGTIFKSWITEVVVESAKNFMADMCIGGIERLFYGKSYHGGGGYSSPLRRDYVSYDQAGMNVMRMKNQQGNQTDGTTVKPRFTYNDVTMSSERAAANFYSILNQAIAQYNNISVAEVFDCMERSLPTGVQMPFTIDFTDNYIGWKKELPVNIRRINRNCYKLELPAPISL